MNFIENKFYLLIISLVKIFYSIFQVLFSISIIKIIDALTQLDKVAFNKAILFLVFCIVSQNVIYLIKIYTDKKFIRINMTYIKQKMYNAVFNYNIEDFSSKPIKYYTSFFLNDLNMLENRYYSSILSIIDGISMLLCASIGIIYVNAWFLICLPITMLACIYFPKVFDKKLQQISNKIIQNNLNITGVTEEQLNGFITIKIFKMFQIAKKIRNINIEKTEKSKEDLSRYISYSNALLSIFAIFLIYFCGGNLVFKKVITLSALVGLNNILTSIVNHCVMLPQHFQFLNSSKSIRNLCIEIINYKDIDSTIDIGNSKFNIDINNLTYKYNNDSDNIIKDVTFTFEHGKKYAIIGDNGSGKSTFIKLVSGLYHNYKGSIKYGDCEQNKINRESLFNNISFMSQEVFIFEDTVENNIKLYNEDMNIEYERVIKQLQIDKLIEKCKCESKNALQLSGGEKQKVSFARVLLRNSNIIIADEPTSALDKKSTEEFEKILLSLKDVTCIVITHDVDEHLQNYDEVIVMKDGSIVEHGKYDDLATIHAIEY